MRNEIIVILANCIVAIQIIDWALLRYKARLERQLAIANELKQKHAIQTGSEHMYYRQCMDAECRNAELIKALQVCQSESELLWHSQGVSSEIRHRVALISDASINALKKYGVSHKS